MRGRGRRRNHRERSREELRLDNSEITVGSSNYDIIFKQGKKARTM